MYITEQNLGQKHDISDDPKMKQKIDPPKKNFLKICH